MPNLMLFNKWDASQVKIEDMGLAGVMNFRPLVVPRTGGRFATKEFGKQHVHVVERFMNRLMVPGHRGKRHKIYSRNCTASAHSIYLATKEALQSIEEKTKKNPLQVFVKAIENAALLEEVASYRLGGIIARKAVTVSPTRRLDLALRYLTQGIYRKSFNSKRTLAQAIVEEILAAYENDAKSFAIQERARLEKEAEGAR